MKNSMQAMLNFILARDCCRCGAFGDVSGPLCRPCLRLISEKFSSDWVEERSPALDPPVRSLYSWTPGKGADLAKLLYRLKTASDSDWRFVGQLFLKNISVGGSASEGEVSTGMQVQNLVFVPIPSRPGRNHSLRFARSLAQCLGGQVSQVLILPPNSDNSVESGGRLDFEQKRLGRSARQRRTFECSEHFTSNDWAKARLILVDDVVTTGSSVRAAWTALGCPPTAEAWCVAQRTRLAGHC